jgi:triosephosphate isomerase
MKKIIVANLKMNLVLKFESDNWVKNFIVQKQKKVFDKTEVVICPSPIHLAKFVEELNDVNIAVGTQDCFWERKGSYTGGVSAATIKSVGGEYTIVGHSERRKYFGETDELIALKLKTATSVGLKTILCIGETAEEKQQDLTGKVLNKQLENCLKYFSQGQLDKLLICYEPVWAISSNNPVDPPTADEIMTARLMIKKILVKKYGTTLAGRIKILYGGSVDRRNIEDTCLESGMDGVLVGKASLVPSEFFGIMQKLEEY